MVCSWYHLHSFRLSMAKFVEYKKFSPAGYDFKLLLYLNLSHPHPLVIYQSQILREEAFIRDISNSFDAIKTSSVNHDHDAIRTVNQLSIFVALHNMITKTFKTELILDSSDTKNLTQAGVVFLTKHKQNFDLTRINDIIAICSKQCNLKNFTRIHLYLLKPLSPVSGK